MVSADTWLLALCEGAILGWDDETAFHATLFGAFTWATNRRHDVSTYPGIDPGNHRNFPGSSACSRPLCVRNVERRASPRVCRCVT